MDEQGNILCDHSCGSPEIASIRDQPDSGHIGATWTWGSAANADIHVLKLCHQLDEMKKDKGLIQDGNVAVAR
jgi:hypothetical protein